ncbi:hypothetical protein ABHI18_004364 [Aspergillus niger]
MLRCISCREHPTFRDLSRRSLLPSQKNKNGVWRLVKYQHSGHSDFAYIKDQNAGTNKVEVHIASGASTSQNRVQEVATMFGGETDAALQLFDWNEDGILDLVFIKICNTGTGDVEVHVASGASQTFAADSITRRRTVSSWVK